MLRDAYDYLMLGILLAWPMLVTLGYLYVNR